MDLPLPSLAAVPRRLVAGLALLVAAGLGGSAAAGDLASLDAQNGFRDARFGAAADSVEGLQLLSPNSARGTTLYVRAEEDLAYGGATLDGVTYGFYAGRLYFVTLFSTGVRNAAAVLEELRRAYGPGSRLAGENEEYVWQGSRVLLHYRVDAATGMGMAALTSLPMNARVEADLAASVPASPAP